MSSSNESQIVYAVNQKLETGDILQLSNPPERAVFETEEINFDSRQKECRLSWRDSFNYREENVDAGINGLREPQIGALHAIHAHWSVSSEPATIVMPTGTGKTETMLATLISKRCERVLIVVPTDALRQQVADKFITLGILKKVGVISEKCQYPIVGILKHKPKDLADVDELFEKCNVVVSTMNIVGQCNPEIQDLIARHCQYLFIDEAHHLGARIWTKFKEKFKERLILQFTATPFRNDDKAIGGKIIYKYPLRKAQENGYFKKIKFEPVQEFDRDRVDVIIAEKAIAQLRKDPANHILMARVENVARAKRVFLLYEKYKEFNPVQIHTGVPSSQREKIRKSIINKESRIIICVDMLGEGFDLPELKIAAFHDIKKSLAVTLQLAGRFTRSREDLGDATFIANIADVNVQHELQKLYAQDPDWNLILEQSSEKMIKQQIELQNFIDGFSEFPDSISLAHLRPAMSTVIYKTKCQNWNPSNFEKGIPGIKTAEKAISALNENKNTLVVVKAKKVPVDWAQVKDIFNWDWELYILYWDKKNNLLFIHNSNNSGYYKPLAEAVVGESELINGASVFRCFSGINRIKLLNVGLLEYLGKLIRFTMHAGADVESGLSEAQKRNVIKSNIFGTGFELGEKASVGCSYKGRIWSRRISNLPSFIKWCKHIGKKVIDESINPSEILKGTLVPVSIDRRPNKLPFNIDWPELIYRESESAFYFYFGEDKGVPITHVDIRLKDSTVDGGLKFEVFIDNNVVEFELIIEEKSYSYSKISGEKLAIEYRGKKMPLENFFYDYSPAIWFVDGSYLEGNGYVEAKSVFTVFPVDKIIPWSWEGINIRKESQGLNKESDSIQHKVIQQLKFKKYDIIFDDDGSGESADVVAIKAEGQEKITVEFYHCKYSHGDAPGSRVDDLYEVCGQALKSVHWKDEAEMRKLFLHLLRRESKRRDDPNFTRFEIGDSQKLQVIMDMSQQIYTELKIFIVQPGLSKKAIGRSQQELLAVTENYLLETYRIPFSVVASE